MAWEPSLPPWGWDRGALFPGHLDTDKENQALYKDEVHMSPSKGASPENIRVPFAKASSSLAALHHKASDMEHARFQPDVGLPFAMGPSETFTLEWNDKNESCKEESTKNATAGNSFEDSWKSVTSAVFLELGSHASQVAQTTDPLPGKGLNEGKMTTHSNEEAVFHPKQQTKLPLGANHDEYGGAEELQDSTVATGSAGSGDSSIGLHLGKRTYFQDVAGSGAKQDHKVSNTKKTRTGACTSRTPRCQVEGCETDLSSAKEYHRRHKVCPLHSKAEKAIVAKQEKRFCQQCSRFHLLSEFDDTKRSCRRRLANHNERRRKPQIDSRVFPVFHHPTLFGCFSNPEDCCSVWNQHCLLQSGMYDCTLQTGRVNQSGCNGPKLVICNSLGSGQGPQELSACNVPVGNNLKLMSTSSSSSAAPRVTPSFETALIMQARVSDSGRALSLLSLPSQVEYHVSDTIGPCGILPKMTTGTIFDNLMNEDLFSKQHYRQEQAQLRDRHGSNKVLPMDTPLYAKGLMHSINSTAGSGGMMGGIEGSFVHGWNMGVGVGFENDLCLAKLQGLMRAPDEEKETVDLMPYLSFQPQEGQPGVVFELGASTPIDLQCTYGSLV